MVETVCRLPVRWAKRHRAPHALPPAACRSGKFQRHPKRLLLCKLHGSNRMVDSPRRSEKRESRRFDSADVPCWASPPLLTTADKYLCLCYKGPFRDFLSLVWAFVRLQSQSATQEYAVCIPGGTRGPAGRDLQP